MERSLVKTRLPRASPCPRTKAILFVNPVALSFFMSTPCPSFPNACSPLIPGLAVVVSYGVAISYVTADAVAKGYKCAKESDSK